MSDASEEPTPLPLPPGKILVFDFIRKKVYVDDAANVRPTPGTNLPWNPPEAS